MNIKELKAGIKNLPDEMELVGEFGGNQDDFWMGCVARRNEETGMYEEVPEGIERLKDLDKINFLLKMG